MTQAPPFLQGSGAPSLKPLFKPLPPKVDAPSLSLVGGSLLSALLVVGALSLCCAPPAHAQPSVSSFDVRAFESTIDAQGMAVTERAIGLATGDLNLGLGVDFAFNPLKQRFRLPEGEERANIIARYTTAQLSASFGLWGHLTLGLSQPLLILTGDLDGPGDTPSFSTDGLGDTRLSAKLTALDSRHWPVGLAFALNTKLALKSAHPLATEGETPLFTPWLILDSELSRVAFALNVGYVTRSEGALNSPIEVSREADEAPPTLVPPLNPIELGPELAYRAGLELRYLPQTLHHSFELIGALPVGAASGGERLELITALRLLFHQGSHLTFGLGRGLVEGYSSPDLRAFMAITFQPVDLDLDGDGLPDSRDACPREAEDKDGFEDQDGCPDNDNDQDGLPDLFDQCPERPEDKNGFEDDDGCPDDERDLDRDGVPDTLDECKLLPEDKDGFADQDGCPDPDNDGDGIADEVDRCPNDSEDFDTHEDEDGCPDLDNDNDGISDLRDECPHVPEDKDGVDDLDGCPDNDTPPETISVGRGRLDVKGMVYFKTGSATIRQESFQLLLEVAIFLNNHPELREIEVQGHTDARGRFEANMQLSAERAAEVRRFLITEGSVEEGRLKSRGYGSTRPLVSGDSREAHARNRRVEFEITQSDSPQR